MDSPNTDLRLDRIEEQLDKLTTIISQLARIEERSANQQSGIDRIGNRLDNYEERIEILELTNAMSSGVSKAVRVIWIGIVAIGGLFIGYHSK